MYEAFFGLRERPFELTPNPRYLFLNSRYREALAMLVYGLTAPRGITLLLGEVGTGKTTLLNAALGHDDGRAHRHVMLSNPTLTRSEFYQLLAEGFGFRSDGSKARFLLDLRHEVAERRNAGGITAIVVDEAQSLPEPLFEEVRLLANLETETTKLVNVVLVGQPELAARLNLPSMRALRQRVSLRCSLVPFDSKETASYIALRLRVAGAKAADVFTGDAIGAIYEASRGIPRTIGVICDNALITAFGLATKPVTPAIVAEVCSDFDLSGDSAPAAAKTASHSHEPEAETNDDHAGSIAWIREVGGRPARHELRPVGGWQGSRRPPALS